MLCCSCVWLDCWYCMTVCVQCPVQLNGRTVYNSNLNSKIVLWIEGAFRSWFKHLIDFQVLFFWSAITTRTIENTQHVRKQAMQSAHCVCVYERILWLHLSYVPKHDDVVPTRHAARVFADSTCGSKTKSSIQHAKTHTQTLNVHSKNNQHKKGTENTLSCSFSLSVWRIDAFRHLINIMELCAVLPG